MLDKKSESLLALLLDLAGLEYTVLDKNVLSDKLPARHKMNPQSVTAALTYLKENGYISVKYQDKEEICLCATIKAQSYFEGEKALAPKTKIANAQIWLLFLGVFAAAFCGALAAVFVAKTM